MTVYLIDAALDAELDYIRNNVTERYICAGNPTTRAAAITAALCTLTGLTSGNFSTVVDGDTNGRKVTKLAETGDGIDVDGAADTVCYCSGTTLLWRVDGDSQALTTGGTVDTAAHDHEAADAV
mgnify:CR=1 FL=1